MSNNLIRNKNKARKTINYTNDLNYKKRIQKIENLKKKNSKKFLMSSGEIKVELTSLSWEKTLIAWTRIARIFLYKAIWTNIFVI